MKDFVLVHSDEYQNWVFDPEHPTQGRRFMLGKELLLQAADEIGLTYDVIEPVAATVNELAVTHSPAYVTEVLKGYSGEWDGQRPDLGQLAALFAGGTLKAVDALANGTTRLAVNLPGAKHHAQYDYSSGFCVFADFAVAAHHLGEDVRIAVLDVDAHHGDGTENLMFAFPNWLTFSVHQGNIFPWSGYGNNPRTATYNVPLEAGDGNSRLVAAVSDFIDLANVHEPDYIFVAGGADGHRSDPLSDLRYEVDGMARAMGLLRREFPDMPILFGGAGGYQPDDYTPLCWSAMVAALAR